MPRHHLTLVWPHAVYRPPPDLSVPEVRAAFEAGRAAHGLDEETALQRWMELSGGGIIVPPGTLAAMILVRELMRHRSWREAALGGR